MRESVYCTASFSVFSRRRAKLPIIYPDIRLDYKLATLPSTKPRRQAKAVEVAIVFVGLPDSYESEGFDRAEGLTEAQRIELGLDPGYDKTWNCSLAICDPSLG